MSYRFCCGTMSRSDLSLASIAMAASDPSKAPPAVASSINHTVPDYTASIPSGTVHRPDCVERSQLISVSSELIGACGGVRSESIPTLQEEDEDLYDIDMSKQSPATKRKQRSKRKMEKYKNSKKNHRFWNFRLKKRESDKKNIKDALNESEQPTVEAGPCVCTGYRRTEDHVLGTGVIFSAQSLSLMSARSAATASPLPSSASRIRLSMGAGPGGPASSGIPSSHQADLLQIVPGPGGSVPPGLPSSLQGELLQLVPPPQHHNASVIDLSRFNPDDYPTEDVDELRKAQRARDIELGIEIAPHHVAYPNVMYGGGSPPSSCSTMSSSRSSLNESLWNQLTSSFQNQCVVTTITYPTMESSPAEPVSVVTTVPPSLPAPSPSEATGRELASANPSPNISTFIPPVVHTQVDFIHCLVPDLNHIARCGFYWGVMDRYEAERILENRPEGTFLLRDSAQEDYLFSVSFRRYGRSLHARIEQFSHKFSFDSHDPGVFAAESVTSLIEHYKDPNSCMFFEPMLTIRMNRTFPFSLQHLCRAAICSNTTYDGINYLPLPSAMREYLKYYHYKQKVRVRRLEMQ